MSNSTIKIDVHGLVQVVIDGDTRFHEGLLYYLGDIGRCRAQAESKDVATEILPTIEIIQCPVSRTSNMRELRPGLVVSQSSALDLSYRVEISRLENGIRLKAPNAPVEWLLWSLHIMLLRQNAALVHCAGVANEGKSLLFPSWGGVGKTAIAKYFVVEKGWWLLGDDRVILSSTGRCYGFPQPMVLYPYHRTLFPEFFESGRGPKAPTAVNSYLTRVGIKAKPVLRKVPSVLAWARQHNPQSVRVAPSQIFGIDGLASESQLFSIVWIDRDAAVTKPEISAADGTFSSRVIGSTLSEFDRHCVELTAELCGLGIVSYEALYAEWANVAAKALAGVEKWNLQIPVSLPVADVPTAVAGALESVGILERLP